MILKLLVLSAVTAQCIAQFSVRELYASIGDAMIKSPSNICVRHFAAYLEGIKNFEEWSMQMLDANAKFPSGILNGNFYDVGSFDECLAITGADKKGDAIRGKYCMTSFNFLQLFKYSNTTAAAASRAREERGENLIPTALNWGACVPASCTAEDLNVQNVITFVDELCQSVDDKPQIEKIDIFAISIFSFILLLMIVSTAYDLHTFYYRKKPRTNVLLPFSVIANGRKLFQVIDNPKQLNCLAGIRTLTMMWIILGHEFSMTLSRPIANALYYVDMFSQPHTMYMRGATISVDTFFLLSGTVMVYVFLGSMKGNNKIFFNIPMFYLHRYLRLTPAVAAMVLLHVSILKFFGSGPMWPMMVEQLRDACNENWWTTILYIQNYVHNMKQCVGVTWYLSCDTQLYFLAPLILIPIRKYPKCTFIGILFVAGLSMADGFYVAWHYNMRSVVGTGVLMLDDNYMSKYYVTTHTRVTPWLVGVVLGYILHHAKARLNFRMNKKLNVLLWLMALAVLSACLFGGHNISKEEYKQFEEAAFIAFARPAWAIALSWIIFACATGYGGLVNAFLSITPFQILSRFSFSAYLTHYTIIIVQTFSAKTSYLFSEPLVLYEFWSLFALTLLVSFLWIMAFESPIIVIEKVLFKSSKEKSTSQANLINNDEPHQQQQPEVVNL